MELNILTGKTGQSAREPYKLEVEDFWRVYFRLLATIGQHINSREEDVLAYILSRPSGVDYFSSPHNKAMKSQLKLAASEVTRLKQSLQRKKIIDDNNQPVKGLITLQQYVNKEGKAAFVFPMMLI